MDGEWRTKRTLERTTSVRDPREGKRGTVASTTRVGQEKLKDVWSRCPKLLLHLQRPLNVFITLKDDTFPVL